MSTPLTREQVIEQYKSECSFYVNGRCDTLGCLRRGGYESGCNTANFTPTCAAREAVEVAPLRQQLAQVTQERDEANATCRALAQLENARAIETMQLKQQLAQARENSNG
jgi:hypothetical protein